MSIVNLGDYRMKTREGNYFTETHRECTSCGGMFERIGKDTMRICKGCNTARVKSTSPESKMWQRAKTRCAKSGKEFSIDKEDVVIPKLCPILGIELEVHKGSPGGKPYSPSLDRIDSSKGYVKGNVWVISQLANAMKANATEDQLRTFSKYWLDRLGEE